MRGKAPRVAAAASIVPSYYAFLGPRAPEGTYTVKMIKGKETYATTVALVPDPRSAHTAQDRHPRENLEALRAAGTDDSPSSPSPMPGLAGRAEKLPRGTAGASA
jgi:hypothetical protein